MLPRQRRTPTTSGTFDILYPNILRSQFSSSSSTGIPMAPSPRIRLGAGSSSHLPFDAELGYSSRSASSTSKILRLVSGRRGKWIVIAMIAGTMVYYLSDWRSGAGPTELGSGDLKELGYQGVNSDMKGKGKATAADLDLEYIVDRYGDYFYPSYPNSSHIPSFDPDISLLSTPAALFPEVDLESLLLPPNIRLYPESHLREIISPRPAPVGENLPKQEFPEGAFVLNWTGAADWNVTRKQGSGVQYKRETRESKEEMLPRTERAQAVRRGFAHAWQGYKRHAWGHDEVKPVSKVSSDPFNNWGASIIDTLDTLLLLEFNDEYNLCRAHVNQLNFEWVSGRDWKNGYILPAKSDSPTVEDPIDEQLALGRDRNVGLGVFETAIRYLGGLLGAYDLSGDSLMLDRAIDLAEIIKKAYNTQSGLPSNRLDPGSDAILHLGSISLAEIGTMTLELFRLAQITGDRQWHDLAQRTIDYLDTRVIPRSTQHPLIPLWFQPDASQETQLTGTFAWGGLADSYYEYLIKAYRLLGGPSSTQADQYKRIYVESVERSKKILFWDIDIVPGRDLLAIGKWDQGRPVPEVEHLSCFAGAMLGLGAKLLSRPDDMDDAEAFTETCYWLSAATPTGLQPESIEFYEGDTAILAFENVSVVTGKTYHPHAARVDFELEVGEGRLQKDGNGVHHWTDDWSVLPEVETAVEGGQPISAEGAEPQKYYEILKGIPAGTRSVNGRGINRPETIESIFYMYRLTGDKKWQDRGWKMFVSWMEAAKVDGGISSIIDVTKDKVAYGDNMESFTFAETFKYHYLLHTDTDLLSLDDYVLNTEAHPLISNPGLLPGHSKLWTPPISSSPHADLGVRSQGTHAQKWTRYEYLEPLKAGLRGQMNGNNGGQNGGEAPHRGGGKGMGGGGGRPGLLPELPKEFWMRPGIITS